MSVVESLHEARKERLRRIAARAVPEAARASASKPAVVRVSAPDRDYERAWAFEIMGYAEARPRKPRVNDIQRAVAEHFGVQVDDMLSTDRTHATARPRHVAMYLARELTAKSFPQIGRRFGRHHGTVVNAVSLIEEQIAHDAELAARVERIRDLLQTREAWL
jgi:chromosomal replication initiation ATPase DnaA